MDNSPKPPNPCKEFLHLDVEPDGIGMGVLALAYNEEGWEVFTPPAWDNTSRVWRMLLWRDALVPVPVIPDPSPTNRIVAEATPTVVIPPVVIDPVSEQPTVTDGAGESADTTPLEGNSPSTPPPVMVVMPLATASLNFGDEMRRIQADKTLSPQEKIEAIKQVGDAIAIQKARQAGESAWKVWNELYPTSPNFRFLPEGVKA